MATDRVVCFGRYEIIGELAAGGMGTVYLGRHGGEAGFQRLYALKVMHDHLAREQEFVSMLLDEARIASRLHHPNVVPILDLGLQDGRYFLAMDYIEGSTFSQLLARSKGPRSPAFVVQIVIDALDGLHAAHSLTDDDGKLLQLVHRDISRQNIMVGVDGVARVIDFGIAKAEARISATRPGTLKGKLPYMSPEQLSDTNDIDARADIFAIGSVLWTALTGKRLFRASSESSTMFNVLQKPVPPPSTVGRKPPACLDYICLKALERDRDKRYQTAAEMADALRRAALENDLLPSRADIANWVRDTFKSELAARRAAIRERAPTSRTVTAVSISDAAPVDVVSLPPFADGSESQSGASMSLHDDDIGSGPQSGVSKTQPSQDMVNDALAGTDDAFSSAFPPPLFAKVQPTRGGRRRANRRRALWAGVGAVAVLLMYLFTFADSNESAPRTETAPSQAAAPDATQGAPVIIAPPPATEPKEPDAKTERNAETRAAAKPSQKAASTQRAPRRRRPRRRPRTPRAVAPEPPIPEASAPAPVPEPPPEPAPAPKPNIENNPYLR